MRRGELCDYFAGVGVKRLSAVDADSSRSNQHEVGTTRAMREHFLGQTQHQEYKVLYVWLGDDENVFSVESVATHYDARVRQKHRSPEWRLYYPSNQVTEAMREGDTLFLAMHREGHLYFIVAEAGSTSEQQLIWLFDIQPKGRIFVSKEISSDEQELNFSARYILEEIGVEFEDSDDDELDSIVEKLEFKFPTTAYFSRLARESLPNVRVEDDPDGALIAWLNREEDLFRRLERHIVSERLEKGFFDNVGTDVDGFIQFSLSVQNRRKARMGYSLENHLEEVFKSFQIEYDRGAVTENHHKPDFLFSGVEAYRRAPPDGMPGLTMLGAKSSCKDRWRQVLAEAEKIPKKHLLTLEPGISEHQTDQMSASQLQLIVPDAIQDSYTKKQKERLWSLRRFVNHVKDLSEEVGNKPLEKPTQNI